MQRTLFLAGAALLALGGTASAQTTLPTTDSPTTTGTTTAPDTGMAAPSNGMARPDPGTASPGSDASATGTATPPDTGAAAPTTQSSTLPGGAAPPAAGDTPATPPTSGGGMAANDAVQKDWAKYDPKNTGSLTPLAFGSWLMASRGQDMTAQVKKSQTGKQANLPAVKVLNATASDFAKADTDHDRKITPGELTAYLSM